MLNLREAVVLAICLAIPLIHYSRRRSRLPLPPGPKGWPLVGNAFDIPPAYSYDYFAKLGKKLGTKILYFRVFGRSTIVINDVSIAKDLLEKRSATYSSRPHLVMVRDLVGLNHFFSILPYGDVWRNHRRLFQQYFSPRDMAAQKELELEFVHKSLLPNLRQTPHHFADHVRGCIGGIASVMTYGLPVQKAHDPMVQLSDDAFKAVSCTAAPGKYLVDVVPWMKYIPEWFPGAHFQAEAREAGDLVRRARDELFQEAQQAMLDGIAKPSFVSKSLEQYSDQADYEYQADHIRQVAATVHGSATDTTTAAVLTFMLAMLKYPEVQKRAQQEIDAIVGSNRLPEFSDESQLPYLAATLKEVLRWSTVAPLGLPHFTDDEDVYEGYFIPKGTTVFANAYAMLRDEDVYPNPTEFNPDRFFINGELSPAGPESDLIETATFGFGRRVCPGAHIAMSTLYIVAASILALFNISPEPDENENPIDPLTAFVGWATVCEPLPYKCKITPRQGKNVESFVKEYLDLKVI